MSLKCFLVSENDSRAGNQTPFSCCSSLDGRDIWPRFKHLPPSNTTGRREIVKSIVWSSCAHRRARQETKQGKWGETRSATAPILRKGKRLFFFSLSTYLVIEADSRRHLTLNRRVCHASRNAVPCRPRLFRFHKKSTAFSPHMRHSAVFHSPAEFLCSPWTRSNSDNGFSLKIPSWIGLSPGERMRGFNQNALMIPFNQRPMEETKKTRFGWEDRSVLARRRPSLPLSLLNNFFVLAFFPPHPL